MRLWRIFGDAAETDMRRGSDGGRGQKLPPSSSFLHPDPACLSSPSAAAPPAARRIEEKPKTARINATTPRRAFISGREVA